MACRIDNATFAQIAHEECQRACWPLTIVVDETPAPGPMVRLAGDDGSLVVLHKKPIQALVDEPEQARPIIRNLLRWAAEQLDLPRRGDPSPPGSGPDY